MDDLPSDPEALKQWMYNLYYEKEDLLAQFYATGAFPNGGKPPRPLEHSGIRDTPYMTSKKLWHF